MVAGLGVARGLPLLCDITCVSSATGNGEARGGCLTVDKGAVQAATRHCHRVDYREVDRSSAARLVCLGAEVYDRWGSEALWTVRLWHASALQGCLHEYAWALRRDFCDAGGGSWE